MPGPIGSGPRPYMNASIDDLAGFVEQHRANPKEIKRILEETRHRSTSKAHKLRDHIQKLIAFERKDDLFADIQPPHPVEAPKALAYPATIQPQPAARPIKIDPTPTTEPEHDIVPEEPDEPVAAPSLEEEEACKCIGVSVLTDWVQVEARRRFLLRELNPILPKGLPESEIIRRRKEADRINQAFRVLFQSRCAGGKPRRDMPPAG